MIECRGVSFSYDGAVPALDGVDLNIEDGEFFCILGGNGSGKSTFAKHLNALLQPDAGTVRINGMDASDPELVYDIRSTAGMVFQNPDDQLFSPRVHQDVAFGPLHMGLSQSEVQRRVEDVADRVVGDEATQAVGTEQHPVAELQVEDVVWGTVYDRHTQVLLRCLVVRTTVGTAEVEIHHATHVVAFAE